MVYYILDCVQSDKKIKTLTDTAELIEDAVHSATVIFIVIIIVAIIVIIIVIVIVAIIVIIIVIIKVIVIVAIIVIVIVAIIVITFSIFIITMSQVEQSSEMLNSILKWSHNNKISKLSTKSKVIIIIIVTSFSNFTPSLFHTMQWCECLSICLHS